MCSNAFEQPKDYLKHDFHGTFCRKVSQNKVFILCCIVQKHRDYNQNCSRNPYIFLTLTGSLTHNLCNMGLFIQEYSCITLSAPTSDVEHEEIRSELPDEI